MPLLIKMCVMAGFVLSLCLPAYADKYDELMKEVQSLKQQVAEVSTLKARISNLEERLSKYEQVNQETHGDHEDHQERAIGHEEHDEHASPFEHDHGGLDLGKIRVHGGLDVRFTDVENVESDVDLRAAEIGVEAELADWLKAKIVFTKENGEEAAIEQGFAQAKFDKINSSVTVGKFFVPFGSRNSKEFFAWPLVTRSDMEEDFFGEEPWIDTGATVRIALPELVDHWHSQLTLGIVNGDNEASFGDGDEDTSEGNDYYPVFVRLEKKYDHNGYMFHSGLSGAFGSYDDAEDLETTLIGFDFGVAFKDLGVGTLGFDGEVIYRKKEETNSTLHGQGYVVSTNYRIPLAYKYIEYIDLLFAYGFSDATESTEKRRYSPQLTLGLTENIKIRFLYDFKREDPSEIDNDQFLTQLTYHF